jgi:heat shock protein HspQ
MLPEYRNRKVVVYVREERLYADNDDEPIPSDEQLEKMYTMCRGVLEGMTREEFEQLREERIMGVKR